MHTLADGHTIERPLGRGGMAAVCVARDLKRRRERAVNLLLRPGFWQLLNRQIRARLVGAAERQGAMAFADRYGLWRVSARQWRAWLHSDSAPARALVLSLVDTAKLACSGVVIASRHPANLHPE